MAGHGGRRPGAGRPHGSKTKSGQELREAARQFTVQALEVLRDIALSGESEAARVSAANALLDRGYGKPSTVLAGDEDGGPMQLVTEVVLRGVRPGGDG